MGLMSILNMSRAGLGVERARLEVEAANLANAQTPIAPGQPGYQPLTALVQSAAMREAGSGALEDLLPQPFVAQVVPMKVAPRRVYDPGHPDADAKGYVSYPGVDPVATMLNLISISRSYEANLKAFDITRALMERTLEMGGQG
jgi:flagellar basal-body rod protein FlgC